MNDSTKTSVSFQGHLEIDAVKAILRNLLESIDDGKVVVQRGVEHVILTPADSVEFSLTGKSKKGKQSLEIELSWREAAVKVDAGDLSITSTVPELPPEAMLIASPDGETNAPDVNDLDEEEG